MTLRNAIRESMSRYSRERSEEEEYLTYYDVKLSYADMNCLRDSEGWLNDNNILFWETYLEQHELSRHPGNTVKLLAPSMVQLLKLSPNPAALKDDFAIPQTTSHIFLPVNDARACSANAGSHWSLLVVGVADRVAFHYDSMTPSNLTEARLVVSKLQQLLGIPIRFANLEDTPQQEKTNECGVHVCWAMKHLLTHRLLLVDRDREVDMSLARKRLDQAKFRREMVHICEALRKGNKQRRSEDESLSFLSPPSDSALRAQDGGSLGRRRYRRSWHGESTLRYADMAPETGSESGDTAASEPVEDGSAHHRSSLSKRILPSFLHRERRHSDEIGSRRDIPVVTLGT